MNQLIKIVDGKPQLYSLAQFQRENPNISVSVEGLAQFGIYPFVQGQAPTFDSTTQTPKLTEFKLVDGKWRRDWYVEDAPEGVVAANVRHNRDQLLTQDVDIINAVRWNAMSEEERQAWTDYRQALLNVPQQEGFPMNVTWPTKP